MKRHESQERQWSEPDGSQIGNCQDRPEGQGETPNDQDAGTDPWVVVMIVVLVLLVIATGWVMFWVAGLGPMVHGL